MVIAIVRLDKHNHALEMFHAASNFKFSITTFDLQYIELLWIEFRSPVSTEGSSIGPSLGSNWMLNTNQMKSISCFVIPCCIMFLFIY